MSGLVDVPPPAATARPTSPRAEHERSAAPGGLPSEPELSTIRAALICASRAPSIRNTQPWRWRRGRDGLELLSDDSRWLAAADPGRMDLLLSCGAVLHHARIAFAALGWSSTVTRMPDGCEPAHLATLHFTHAPEATITAELLALSAAMARRFSDHEPFCSWEVPDGILHVLRQAGTDQGAVVATVDSGVAIGELTRASTIPDAVRRTRQDVPNTDEDASIFLVVGAEHPDDESLLRAGEAASAILLEATAIGLSTCLISLSADTLGARRLVRSTVSPDVVDPCLAVRVGWAHVRRQPPRPTPRLPLGEILQP